MAETTTTLGERIAFLHTMGLDRRYDDVLLAEHADDMDDVASMAAGTHYDYRAQRWVEGHDHAHYATGDGSLPLLFCGSDRTTCVGIEVVR